MREQLANIRSFARLSSNDSPHQCMVVVFAASEWQSHRVHHYPCSMVPQSLGYRGPSVTEFPTQFPLVFSDALHMNFLSEECVQSMSRDPPKGHVAMLKNTVGK